MGRASRTSKREETQGERVAMDLNVENTNTPVRATRVESRVLLVVRSKRDRERIATTLRAKPWLIETVQGVRAARDRIAEGGLDLVLIETQRPDDATQTLICETVQSTNSPALVALAHKPSVELAVSAMRDGADDFLDGTITGEALIERLEAALIRGADRRERESERDRLRKMCTKLNGIRREMFDQIGTMCDDLVSAYGELSEQIDVLDVLHEFQSMVKRELDVEALLRTVLEYLLAKGGPMNAAVFLPDTYGDFSLGAYVNYDCPRDTGEAMLDHLADVLPAEFADSRQIAMMRSEAELESILGDDAHWLTGHGVLVMSCKASDESLAVVALFRDRRNPFEAKFLSTLEVIRDAFADQLQRVIRIHHRHQPEDEMGYDDGRDEGEFDEPGDLGFAA